MKAIRYHAYGGPDVLRCEDVDVPMPADDQVLIRVHAASVNPLDWHFMRGTPFAMRLQAGVRAPRDPRFGVDVAGRVEAIGSRVTEFTIGDEVFGTVRGGFAELACGTARSLAKKPSTVSFEAAAAAGVAAITALQALRDRGRLQQDDRVLVNGASGGVGTYAVQMAKSFGAHVTAVCSAKNAELIRSIGADMVVDYATDDFTAGAARFDVVVDMIGGQSLRACRRAMTRNGRYVIVGGPPGRWIAPFDRVLGAIVMSRFVGQDFGIATVRANRDDFETIADLLGRGAVRSVIDRDYSLADVAAAIAYLEQGHARGKVIIRIARQSAGL